MSRLLVDLNVVLDVLLERKPWADAASALWAAAEQRRFAALLPAHGFTTFHYLARRERDAAFAKRTLHDLLSVFDVAAIDASVLRRAATLEMADFEDAVCAAAGEAAGCQAIVTRDPKGYGGSPLPTIDPATALALASGSA